MRNVRPGHRQGSPRVLQAVVRFVLDRCTGRFLHHIRRGRIHSVHTLREDFGELIEAEALETSDLVGKPLKEIKMPSGVMLGAIVREGEMFCPGGSTIVEPKDRVILFASAKVIRKVEKLFSVQLEYF